MFRKLLVNKKNKIVVSIVLLAIMIGIIILVLSNNKETDGKGANTKIEQGQEDTDIQDDKSNTNVDDKKDVQESGGTSLEVLEPDEVAPEDFSDASGAWGNTSDSNTQTGNTTDNTDTTEDKGQDENKEDDDDILEDNIDWGNIY